MRRSIFLKEVCCMPKKPAKVKAKSKYIDEYRKERKRVRDFISRAKRKGEIIPADVLPPITKRITQGSINRLKKLTAKALHEKATTYINTVTGEVMPEGTTVVKQRREIKKAKEKEKTKLEKELEELKKKMAELEKENKELKKELENEKKRREIEEEEPEEPEEPDAHEEPVKSPKPEKTDEPVDVDTKTYETILDEINQWDPLVGWSPSLAAAKEDDVNVLRSILEGAIRSEGLENVMKRLNDRAAEVADLTEKILYAYGPGQSYDAGVAMVQECLTRFTEILYGGMLDAERTRAIVDDAESHRNADWWENE